MKKNRQILWERENRTKARYRERVSFQMGREREREREAGRPQVVQKIITLMPITSNPTQDTLKSPPPESKTMKKASLLSVFVTTFFYLLCGCSGYAAFGDSSPGNLLTGFGFFEPFWLIDIANAAIVIHLVGAFQVYCQPLFAFVESWAHRRWSSSSLITSEFSLFSLHFNAFRLLWRTSFVVTTTVISMLLPFFNDVVGFLGAIGFWPLTVYFPVQMFINQKKIRKWSRRWVCLQMLSVVCFGISAAAAAGSIVGIFLDFKSYRPFKAD